LGAKPDCIRFKISPTGGFILAALGECGLVAVVLRP